MKVLNESEFKSEVLDFKGVVLVDFYADWCGPCRAVAPVLEELSKQYEGKAKFVKVNVDESRNLAVQYQIMGIPTVIVFKDGQMVENQSGAGPAPFYMQMLDKHVS